MMKRTILLSGLIFSMAFSCSKDTPTPVNTLSSTFELQGTYPITPHIIDEASGLCDSRSMSGNVWVEEDSDNPNVVHLLSQKGVYVGNVQLPFPNRDWEDITIGVGPDASKTYIYMAEIGDNDAVHQLSYVYRFVEPKSLDDKVTQYDAITFKYPDGPRDAECILLDPETKDIYIVSKREAKVHLYQLAYPQSTTETITAKYIAELPYTYVTSGGISTDGKEIVIKTYTDIFYWQRKTGETIIQALSRAYDKKLPYYNEPQGEGFCFDKEGKGYYTISEIYTAPSVNLYYYARK